MRASPGEGERHVHALPLLPACKRLHAAFHRSASGSPTGSHPASGDAEVESFGGHVMATAPVETLRQLLVSKDTGDTIRMPTDRRTGRSRDVHGLEMLVVHVATSEQVAAPRVRHRCAE